MIKVNLPKDRDQAYSLRVLQVISLIHPMKNLKVLFQYSNIYIYIYLFSFFPIAKKIKSFKNLRGEEHPFNKAPDSFNLHSIHPSESERKQHYHRDNTRKSAKKGIYSNIDMYPYVPLKFFILDTKSGKGKLKSKGNKHKSGGESEKEGVLHHQPVPGSSHHQAVLGSSLHQAVPGSSQYQPVAGSSHYQAVPANSHHQPVSGSGHHQAVPASSQHQALAGSSKDNGNINSNDILAISIEQLFNDPPPPPQKSSPKLVIKTLGKPTLPLTFDMLTDDLLSGLSKTKTTVDRSTLLNLVKQLNLHLVKVEQLFAKKQKDLMSDVSSQWSLLLKTLIYQYSDIPAIRVDQSSQNIYKTLCKSCDKWRTGKK